MPNWLSAVLYLIGLSVSAVAAYRWMQQVSDTGELDGGPIIIVVIMTLASWAGVAMLLAGYLTVKVIRRLP